MDYGLKTVPWSQAIPQAFQGVYEQSRQFVLLPVHLIEGTIAPDQARLVSIVGLADEYNSLSQMDAQASTTPVARPPLFRLSFFVAISIALGLTNLLPIPALDGGHMALLSYEKLRRKDLTIDLKEKILTGGFLLLASLMGLVIVLDLLKLRK